MCVCVCVASPRKPYKVGETIFIFFGRSEFYASNRYTICQLPSLLPLQRNDGMLPECFSCFLGYSYDLRLYTGNVMTHRICIHTGLALNMDYYFNTIFEGRTVSLCGQHSKTFEWSCLVDLIRHTNYFTDLLFSFAANQCGR